MFLEGDGLVGALQEPDAPRRRPAPAARPWPGSRKHGPGTSGWRVCPAPVVGYRRGRPSWRPTCRRPGGGGRSPGVRSTIRPARLSIRDRGATLHPSRRATPMPATKDLPLHPGPMSARSAVTRFEDGPVRRSPGRGHQITEGGRRRRSVDVRGGRRDARSLIDVNHSACPQSFQELVRHDSGHSRRRSAPRVTPSSGGLPASPRRLGAGGGPPGRAGSIVPPSSRSVFSAFPACDRISFRASRAAPRPARIASCVRPAGLRR